ncbi:M48 family metallopeptidase [Alteribacillus iranensis]|uniref:YgjP-like metallopeptidase domain-containing protein n=1 Tax=Alteribacillus iranensis TaxID=930128 RepID=A0A1I2D439_9BACI|nr:SprT family zinc-dependent metalloprotease [Alteribacillus iranensis]SFE75264.1 hypothetical protein SAMN05192532_103395 [Alteribacillus iranensis]
MPTFQFGTTPIDYDLKISSSAKEIKISVDWQDGVCVLKPSHISDNQLQHALQKKAPWILAKWQEINEIEDPAPPKEFVSGEKFPYIGRHYRLKVDTLDSPVKASLRLYRGRFYAQIPTLEEDKKRQTLHQLFKDWYVQHGQTKVEERLELYKERMGVSPSRLLVKDQKMRWGTCTHEGAIYLNWRIMMAPMTVIDYILVHELSHLMYPNHSKEFWACIKTYLPDYEAHKEWLRINGPRLTLQ